MPRRRSLAAVCGLTLLTAVVAARADTSPPAGAGLDPWRPGLLAPGALQAGLGLWMRATDHALALAPELWVGAGSRLTVGGSHGPGSDGLAAPGRGLCLRGCGPRYRGALTALVGLGARPGLVGRAQLVIDDLAPAVVAVELGVTASWRQGRAWARFEPGLRLGLIGRARDNRERAGVALAAGAELADTVSLGAVVGPRGPADEQFFAGLIVPARLEASTRLRSGWMIGATVGTDDVFAAGGGHAQATLAVAWRR